jgi:hypothetical protein
MPFDDPTNVTGFVELLQYTNSITNEWFGNTVVIMVFTIAFLSLKQSGHATSDALTVSSFISAVLTIFLLVMNVTGHFAVFLLVMFLGAGVAGLLTRRN